MLAELEAELLAGIRLSPLAPKLREISVMPSSDPKTLLATFLKAVPAVFSVIGDPVYSDDSVTVPFGLVCLTRNMRGTQAARHGDDQTIGLYPLIDALVAHVHGLPGWRVERVFFSSAPLWIDNGIQAATVRIATKTTYDTELDLGSLDDFKTFHADFDVDPHQPTTEHQKWAAEPPDYSASRPELTDNVIIQP